MSPDELSTNGQARGLQSASPLEPENIKPGTASSAMPTARDNDKHHGATSQHSSKESTAGSGFVMVDINNSKGRPKQPESVVEVEAASSYPGNIHNLHPISRILTISDLESCCALEDAVFEKPEERCSREKFIYRLTSCGELSLGLFTTATPESMPEVSTSSFGRVVETGRGDGTVGILMAHISGTKTKEEVVTDEAMDYPKDWDSENRTPSTKGHQEDGRTIALHSFAVDKYFQGKNLGSTLMSAYIGMINGSGIADRIALITHENMVPFYEKMKFIRKGPSKAEFGGGNWVDMVYELYPHKPVARYG